jgi:hypothetical protein
MPGGNMIHCVYPYVLGAWILTGFVLIPSIDAQSLTLLFGSYAIGLFLMTLSSLFDLYTCTRAGESIILNVIIIITAGLVIFGAQYFVLHTIELRFPETYDQLIYFLNDIKTKTLG